MSDCSCQSSGKQRAQAMKCWHSRPSRRPIYPRNRNHLLPFARPHQKGWHNFFSSHARTTGESLEHLPEIAVPAPRSSAPDGGFWGNRGVWRRPRYGVTGRKPFYSTSSIEREVFASDQPPGVVAGIVYGARSPHQHEHDFGWVRTLKLLEKPDRCEDPRELWSCPDRHTYRNMVFLPSSVDGTSS